jgi:quercetin dioxygenase-like cupin family protein
MNTHGHPAQPNADVFFKVPGHSDIALHTHSSSERMALVGGALLVNYEGEAPVRLTPGMYAYGPAGRPHSARCESADPRILMIAFEGPVDAIPAPARAR